MATMQQLCSIVHYAIRLTIYMNKHNSRFQCGVKPAHRRCAAPTKAAAEA